MPQQSAQPKKDGLKTRFERFITTLSGVESIDAHLAGRTGVSACRADYMADNQSLIIELKTLEDDTEWKVAKILEPYRSREDFPLFLGKWELTKVLKHLSDGDQIHDRIIRSITTSVRKDFRQANNQIKCTKELFRIPGSQGLLVILNENVEIISPDTLFFILNAIAQSKHEDGAFRYTEVSAILLISEAHGKQVAHGVLGHPITLMKLGDAEEFAHEAFIQEVNAVGPRSTEPSWSNLRIPCARI